MEHRFLHYLLQELIILLPVECIYYNSRSSFWFCHFQWQKNPRNTILRIVCYREKVFKAKSFPFLWSFGRRDLARIRMHVFTKFYPVTLANRSSVDGDTDVRDGGAGGGKYIMSLVKLSFYDHFMVARDPSMLSTYRCAFLTTALGARADSSRISFIIRVGRTL